MSFFVQVIGIAFALSIDAMVVALCWSATQKSVKAEHIFKFAAAFGLFQMLMPLAGGLIGSAFAKIVGAWDHWIAFFLLAWVAFSMIKEGFGGCDDETCPAKNSIAWGTLLTLSVATSLDALAVGFSFALAQFPILWPSIVIGVVCFILTAFAVYLGNRLSAKAACHSAKLSFAGAAVLLLIGLKILSDHGVFDGVF